MGYPAETLESSVTSTVQIEVDLDTSANPPVIVARKTNVKSGKKIKWKKAAGAPDFQFTGFNGDSPPFESVDISDSKIECDFNTPPADPEGKEYAYTITVQLGKDTYTTTKQEMDPAGDKPVIRNQ